jgi:hypothetical protein
MSIEGPDEQFSSECSCDIFGDVIMSPIVSVTSCQLILGGSVVDNIAVRLLIAAIAATYNIYSLTLTTYH